MKEFREDAYHPLAKYTCFSSHQMSVPVGSHKNKFEQVSSHGHQMSLAESTGAGASWGSMYSAQGHLLFPCTVRSHVQRDQDQRGLCTVRSHVQRGGGGSLYDKVQCIMGNHHRGSPPASLLASGKKKSHSVEKDKEY